MTVQPYLKRLTSIVAIDRNGAIGAHNALPWRLKSDLSYFKQTTLENIVIMGRKTYDSIGKCLPNRINIVLSHNFELFRSTETCFVALSLGEAIYRAECSSANEIFVVGGAMTYEQFAPLVDRYLVTFVDHVVPNADSYLASSILNDLRHWDQVEQNAYPAVAGQDQFAFKVVEIKPSDPEERQERRREIFRTFAAQVRIKPNGASRRHRAENASQQLSFI